MENSNWNLNDVIFDLEDLDENENLTRDGIHGKNISIHDFTLDQCTKNFSILGASGSGKTSGFAQFINYHFAYEEFSIIVPTAKNDEKDRWDKIAEAAGRKDKIVVFEKGSRLCFDPLMYLSSIEGGTDIQNLVSMLLSISKTASKIAGTGTGGSRDPFWDRAVSRLLFNIISLLQIVEEDISFTNIDKLGGELFNEKFDTKKSEESIKNRFLYTCKFKARRMLRFCKEESFEFDQISRTLRYVEKDFYSISERTLSIIREVFFGIIGPFLESPTLNEAMVGKVSSELRPENIMKDGSIVLINYPILEQYIVGGIIQATFLHLMTQAVERRNLETSPRPVAFIIDEAHYFINQHLMKWLSTGRSKLGITVLISQSVDNYLALMEGHNPKASVDSFMNNLATKVMCNSSSFSTLNYFAETSTRSYKRVPLENAAGQTYYSDREEYRITPEMFMKLKPGGERHV